ncbi:uncharacterized protein ARMOST_08396 [Armillaria ostoyae]|uniref:Uncharacterized protein n=1 Tax=Armillaria ostoyae TaxID=47428 RepID=A0A284R8J2_ARMOS|nr:uncharacterized protein ARMOST_08396 [Armillaria ostoyae]
MMPSKNPSKNTHYKEAITKRRWLVTQLPAKNTVRVFPHLDRNSPHGGSTAVVIVSEVQPAADISSSSKRRSQSNPLSDVPANDTLSNGPLIPNTCQSPTSCSNCVHGIRQSTSKARDNSKVITPTIASRFAARHYCVYNSQANQTAEQQNVRRISLTSPELKSIFHFFRNTWLCS